MTRKRKVLMGVGIVIGLIALVWGGVAMFGESRPVPSYQGKPVTEWLDLSQSANRSNFKAAMEAMGQEAAPFLLDEYAREYRVRNSKSYRWFWGKLPVSLQSWLGAPMDPQRNRVDLSFLASMTDLKVGAEMLAPVVTLCEEQELSAEGMLPWRMLDAIAKYDDATPAIPVLRRMLGDSQKALPAASILAQIGPPAKIAVPDMAAALHHDPFLMANYLSLMGADAEAAIPRLEDFIAGERGRSSPTPSQMCPPRNYLWQCVNLKLEQIKAAVEQAKREAGKAK